MKKILFILVLGGLFSCGSKDNNSGSKKSITTFPIQKELKAEVVSVSPNVLLYAFNIFTTNNKLITFNSKKDLIFDVFQLPELNYMYSAGIIGQGPSDFINLDRRSFMPTKKGFKVLFTGKKQLKEVLVNENNMEIDQENIVALKEIVANEINGFLPINDSLAIYWSGFKKETEYTRVNLKDKELISFSPYPHWSKDDLQEDKLFTYIKNSVLKPDGSKFASFYGYFKKIRIYNTTGKLLNDISVNVSPYNDKIETKIQNRIQYYYGYPKATEQHIYVLCRNAKGDESSNTTELQVWNWNGEAVAQYTLDQPLSLFTISEKYKKIYAVNAEDEKIYVYPLLHAESN